ncbi:secretory pathway Sec39 [Aaosphaeria arxii CBS 175.79]|uniref:Secretory pathway Sec39 n=1 Tax=Aaosphaeria arxii CBS 175.79 TaxID=1450172 RepID=A0A6A5X8G9_9PLEO|nr:secretory pathway Sec39 [Aaosphaeria arxii CBS 175.79]KAF2009248.1 secretory pathway Sec39 [Aaosphaeria arxii CBS 175.79]
MTRLEQLSGPHCILLAAHYASESNITALRALTALRTADLELGLVLRVLLTYLPESLDPSQYCEYLHELAINPQASALEANESDVSSVAALSNSQARKRAHKLHTTLEPLPHPLYESDPDIDAFTHFIIHRSHRIDAEIGQLELILQLVVPFLQHSEYLKTWFISTVLPLLRIGYEYYPPNPTLTLDNFAELQGTRAIEYQLSNSREIKGNPPDVRNVSRDLRGIVGPWICGANLRKRRRLDSGQRRPSIGISEEADQYDWECLFHYLVQTSKVDFPFTTSAFNEWDGPSDLDLGGYDEGLELIGEDQQGKLELRYAQAALASIYLVEDNSMDTLQRAHSLLARLSNLLNLEPPPDLHIGVGFLPSYGIASPPLHGATSTILQEEHILNADNALTQPDEDRVRLLALFIFSACLLTGLQQVFSIRDVAKMYIRNDPIEQNALLQKILHLLTTTTKKDADQWRTIRSKLLWLWSWGTNRPESDRYGQGILGNIEQRCIEIEILKALIESGHYTLIIQTYLENLSGQLPLTQQEVEWVVLQSAMSHYDNASNGNRTRGGVKKASDIIAALGPHFPSPTKFERAQALLSATHAMSSYSLILQHGVPFQPVNIRVSVDPLSLLRKLLSQNRGSYTHLDEMIRIGQNLVISMPTTLLEDDSDANPLGLTALEKRKTAAERRVTGMAIEAALEEDDFETAYSYVVNRLSPSSPTPLVSPALSTASRRFSFSSYESFKEDDTDDVAWRAALNAGRYSSSPMSTSWSSATARPDMRRLEQRMELLSQALILAPPSHLEEVLSVWRECEVEMTNLLAQEAEAEEKFNDRADRRLPGAFAETVALQPRREIGRGAVEEAPMGLFDVARGAAAAFSKSAFPLRQNSTASRTVGDATPASGRQSLDSDRISMGETEEDRVRKRDMVANAVTGGLASGLGWVLGAKPVDRP